MEVKEQTPAIVKVWRDLEVPKRNTSPAAAAGVGDAEGFPAPTGAVPGV